MARRKKAEPVPEVQEAAAPVPEKGVTVPDILADILAEGDEPVAVSYVTGSGLRAVAVFDVTPESLSAAHAAYMLAAGEPTSEGFVRAVESAVGVLAYDASHGAVHRMNL